MQNQKILAKPQVMNYKLLANKGYAALFSFVIMLTIISLILGVFSALVLKGISRNRLMLWNLKNNYAAEGFLEDTARRVYDSALNNPINGESLVVGDATVTLAVSSNAQGKQYSFVSNAKGKYFNGQTLIIDDGGTSASFNYAMQIGDGGLTMGNSSQVEGSVYSNGSIIGIGGNIISGSAFLAENSILDNVSVSGDAQAFRIEDSAVSGNATATEIISSTIRLNAAADLLQSCIVGRDAFYNSLKSCTVGRNKITPFVSQGNLPKMDFPVSESQILLWQDDAVAGGVISGNYAVLSDGSLGPKKIAGNLTVGNSKTLTITGTLWITGKLIMGNNARLILSSDYGENSGVIAVDESVDFGNGVNFSGSGANGSYVIIISKASGAEEAFDLGNNVTGAILYAPYGKINVGNNIQVNQISAMQIELGNNSVLRYENGLRDLRFSGGSAAAVQIKDWRESF